MMAFLPAYELLLMMSGVLTQAQMAIRALAMEMVTATEMGMVKEMTVMTEMKAIAPAKQSLAVHQKPNGHLYIPALNSADLISEQGEG